ncbi:uncharacterized protein [Rutidosis leptorrhynchoides]|uniref:uncharacterized protein n=1 Tax=Rutidosis leptorrhynchoides TaxID=125765 RepID=UPI003A9A5384
MWEDLDKLVFDINLPWVICGDFNEVREESKKKNCNFIDCRARRFNKFINDNCLIDVPLGDRKYTRISGDGKKLSKLDRFLVSEKVFLIWENLIATVFDRDISDHCPIMLRDSHVDFGPKPIKIFDEWYELEGVQQVIKDTCDELGNLVKEIKELKKVVNSWVQQVENRNVSEAELKVYLDSRKEMFEKDKTKSNMLKQKARIRWTISGDENMKYFHLVIRHNYNKCNIRGLSINGIWNEQPEETKEAARTHFKRQFEQPALNRPSLANLNDKVLSSDDANLLEEKFTELEIWSAIKECANNKARDRMGSISSFSKKFGK